jgi:mxaL protein
MKTLIKRISAKFSLHKDFYLLISCFILLILAIFKPSVPVKHNIYSYFMVIDITQSMNASDMKNHGKLVSRLAYTKQMIKETISSLPCDTKVGIGMFSGVNVVALYLPIEVCANFSSIQDSIDHIDWRSAWTADSRIRESMLATAQVLNNFTEPSQVIYFSDGEEAPKLHAFNTRDLSTFQSGDGWLIVGVGSDIGAAIPKYDNQNQHIGYWSHESMQLAMGAAPIQAAGILKRKNDLAENVNDRYISKIDEPYMKSLAKEIGANYLRANGPQSIINAMKSQKPARREWAPLALDTVLASLAGVLLTLAYLPQHPYIALKKKLKGNKISTKKTKTSYQVTTDI